MKLNPDAHSDSRKKFPPIVGKVIGSALMNGGADLAVDYKSVGTRNCKLSRMSGLLPGEVQFSAIPSLESAPSLIAAISALTPEQISQLVQFPEISERLAHEISESLTTANGESSILTWLRQLVSNSEISCALSHLHIDQLLLDGFPACSPDVSHVILEIVSRIGLSQPFPIEPLLTYYFEASDLASLSVCLKVASVSEEPERLLDVFSSSVVADQHSFALCCGFALVCLLKHVDPTQFISSQLFSSLVSGVDFVGPADLVLFLRVVALTANAVPSVVRALDPSFFFHLLQSYSRDDSIQLLLLPLIDILFKNCDVSSYVDSDFVGILGDILREGHFRSRIRVLILFTFLVDNAPDEISASVLSCCPGAELMDLLESDDERWLVNVMSFVSVVVRRYQNRPEISEIVSDYADAWVFDVLASVTGDQSETAFNLLHRLEGLANVVF
jgi:hypothetical protein